MSTLTKYRIEIEDPFVGFELLEYHSPHNGPDWVVNSDTAPICVVLYSDVQHLEEENQRLCKEIQSFKDALHIF